MSEAACAEYLRPNEFAAFFAALHGAAEKPVEPFPWQMALARTVAEQGWPPVLDIPTGAGKTAAIDIAVFHLALEAHKGEARAAPVRVLFVVDRRLVVDDAYNRAKRIAEKLADAKDGVLHRVAERLRLLSEKDCLPLAVARLRGGVPKESEWARTPAQPLIVLSTVDQVGSRLFFRGYGVSDRMKPVHAGLLGADALLLLDEAHLSQPFEQTLLASRRFQNSEPWSDNRAPAPFVTVSLSATQTREAPFGLTDDDWSHDVLSKRLTARKPTELVEVREPADSIAFAEALTKKAVDLSVLAQARGGTIVAIVLNRVKRARRVFQILQKRIEGQGADIALLIGRSRPLDRERLGAFLERAKSGRDYEADARPLFLVATQTIEAGADLDFDTLVTEIAPLDSLRQRFGRLNRVGRDIPAEAAILAAKDQISSRSEDPIYEVAPRNAWAFLADRADKRDRKSIIDFGIESSKGWLPEGAELAPCLAPRPDAPRLLPAYMEYWTRTWPTPAVDPEVSLFLHGPKSGPGDVEIVWRADILDRDLSEGHLDLLVERIATCPPSSLEVLSVPIGEARRWLAGQPAGDVSDLEGEAIPEDSQTARSERALRWSGAKSDDNKIVRARDLRAGDLIIVPAMRGGCDEWGWAPGSRQPVSDLGEEANRLHRRRAILRLSPLLLEIELVSRGIDAHDARRRADAFEELLVKLGERPDRQVIDELLGSPDARQSWGDRLPQFRQAGKVHRNSEGQVIALERKATGAVARRVESEGTATTEDDDSVLTGVRRSVLLADHSAGAEELARQFGKQCGLPRELIEDVALAAYLHDSGKAHPAFKVFLYGGDELAAVGPPLAKSAELPGGRNAWRAAQKRAGLPIDARHEAASVRFARAHPRFQRSHDPELVLWLIGTHHGFGRPFFPAVEWPPRGETFEADLGDGGVTSNAGPQVEDLGAGWAELFEIMKRRYGPWGIARLEAILRLADHRRSEAEQSSKDDAE